MITLFLVGSVGATLILGGTPVVLYGLMLETVKARGSAVRTNGGAPVRAELVFARAA